MASIICRRHTAPTQMLKPDPYRLSCGQTKRISGERREGPCQKEPWAVTHPYGSFSLVEIPETSGQDTFLGIPLYGPEILVLAPQEKDTPE